MKTQYPLAWESQFTIDNFNPDGMTADDMRQWIEFIGNGIRPQVAKQWFPGMEGQFQHARNIRNYLWNKLTAFELRASGSIQTAMQYEAICDRIYSDLPTQAKW